MLERSEADAGSQYYDLVLVPNSIVQVLILTGSSGNACSTTREVSSPIISTLLALESFSAKRRALKSGARRDGTTAIPSWPQSDRLLSGSFIGLIYFNSVMPFDSQ